MHLQVSWNESGHLWGQFLLKYKQTFQIFFYQMNSKIGSWFSDNK